MMTEYNLRDVTEVIERVFTPDCKSKRFLQVNLLISGHEIFIKLWYVREGEAGVLIKLPTTPISPSKES